MRDSESTRTGDEEITTSTSNTVINLSEKSLTSDEVSVLAKGLTFCPQSNYDYVQTRIDVYKYIRKLN